MKGPKWIWFFVNSVFGILVTEIEMAIKTLRTTVDFINLQIQRQNDKYEDLTFEEKKIVKIFLQDIVTRVIAIALGCQADGLIN